MVNTKVLMTVSAVMMFITGITLTFLPQEVLAFFNHESAGAAPLLLQLMGALYFSCGMINWTAKANLIGGIYGRPIAIGNFTHFIVGALALLKGYRVTASTQVLAVTAVYVVFAILFGIVFFTHPIKKGATA